MNCKQTHKIWLRFLSITLICFLQMLSLSAPLSQVLAQDASSSALPNGLTVDTPAPTDSPTPTITPTQSQELSPATSLEGSVATSSAKQLPLPRVPVVQPRPAMAALRTPATVVRRPLATVDLVRAVGLLVVPRTGAAALQPVGRRLRRPRVAPAPASAAAALGHVHRDIT